MYVRIIIASLGMIRSVISLLFLDNKLIGEFLAVGDMYRSKYSNILGHLTALVPISTLYPILLSIIPESAFK